MGKEDWIKETMALLEDLENRKQALHNKYEQMANELLDLQHEIAAGHELIRAYMNKHNIVSIAPKDFKPGSLGNKSYPEMLIDIAKRSGGLLNVSEAIGMILVENVGLKKQAVQKNVYSALSKSEHFVRISKGNYRFTNHMQSTTRKRERSGVREAVKELKNQNPQLTKKEVVNLLMNRGFDFKGKKPMFAVNMAWAYLGYHKEGKQQSLPVVV